MMKSLLIGTVALAALVAVPAAASAQSYYPRNTACEQQNADNKAAGTVIGALLGAAAGGAIGNNVGDNDSRWHYNRGYRGYYGRRGGYWDKGDNDGEVIAGALIGAVVGGMAGNAIASDGNTPCRVATPYGGTYRSTYSSYPEGSIPRTTDGLYGGPEVMAPPPQSSYPAYPATPVPRTYPASTPTYPARPAYPQTTAPAPVTGAPAEECRTVWREARMPDGSVQRDPVTACRKAMGEWEIVDGYADDQELYGY
ncbi:MAG TPA: hypothetical protein PLR76_04520 [Hyphomonas sp.]|nr:hypothetical protein [Hyphomonas sp.]MCB9963163.1 hypothetical protein [Hyphomonas sp.]MCB9970087.1 hypothetical protein [Hyphomonas sp.]HPE47633.1 hypothetical protein [Hyphomonas sp.]